VQGRVVLWLLLISGLLVLSIAAGLRADAGWETLSGTATRTQTFNASGHVKSLAVENVNGAVEIVAGSRFDAKVDVTVKARDDKRAREILDKTKVVFGNQDGELSLYSEPPGTSVRRRGHLWSVHGDSNGSFKVDVHSVITVPADLKVNDSAVNGAVTAKGVSGEQELTTVNGSVETTGARRSMKLSTVNGSISASLSELPKGTLVEARTVNGRIALTLPQKASFRFEGRTMSGDILSTFSLPGAADEKDIREHDELKAQREKIKAEREKVKQELKEKERAARERAREQRKERSEDSETIEIDLSELNESLAELNRDLAEMGRDISRTVTVNLNRSYEGTMGGGEATIRCSNLNGRILLLAEGTAEAQAKRLSPARTARVIMIPPIPPIAIREHPGAAPDALPAPRAPRAPRAPMPPLPPEGEGGDVVRGDIDGDFQSNLPVGDVSLGHVSGHVKVSTQSGLVRLKGAGKGAELSTAGGDIRVDAVTGDLKALTYGGDIRVGSVSGEARLETSGGDVTLKSGGGPVTARTGGGDITLRNLKGSVKASTSGGSISCEIVGLDRAGAELSTSGGDVTLILPANAKADVEVHATGVDAEGEYVVSQFPEISVSRRPGRQTGEGKLNGGGPKVFIRVNSGTVTLKKGPSV
jgi:DUF4097 and DUF4098 domain-containing protein YvlB